MSENPDAKIDGSFFLRRTNRFSQCVCKDNISRNCYKPFSSLRSCLDCHHFDINKSKTGENELWCKATMRNYSIIYDRISDPTKAEKCLNFVLLGITSDYRGLIPKNDRNGVREVSYSEFCRTYPKEVT